MVGENNGDVDLTRGTPPTSVDDPVRHGSYREDDLGIRSGTAHRGCCRVLPVPVPSPETNPPF